MPKLSHSQARSILKSGPSELRARIQCADISMGNDYHKWHTLVSRRFDKQLVAGTIPFRKRKRKWFFALGLRGRGQDGRGRDVDKWSAPVGRNRDTVFKERLPKELKRLISRRDRSDELLFTAFTKLESEFRFSVDLQYFAGRLRPFTGDYPSILVNLFLYIDNERTLDIKPDGKDIKDIKWIPLDVVLRSSPKIVGRVVEEYLTEYFADTVLMHGLYARGMRRLHELFIKLPLR